LLPLQKEARVKKRCEELRLSEAFLRDGKRAYPDVKDFIEVCQIAEDYLDYLAAFDRIEDGKTFLRECEANFIAMIEANKRNTIRTYLTLVGSTVVLFFAKISVTSLY
jgi:hypothetical protein